MEEEALLQVLRQVLLQALLQALLSLGRLCKQLRREKKPRQAYPADSLDVACFSVLSSGPQYLFCFAVSIVRLKDVDEMRSELKMLPCRQQPGFGM